MKKTILFPRSSKFRHGGYATLMIVAALAVVVGVNILVDQIPAKLDLTENRLFSLSDETLKILGGLDDDVTITTLGRPGSRGQAGEGGPRPDGHGEPAHQARDRRPRDEPRLGQDLRKTGNLREGSLVVAVSETKFRTINRYDLYNYQMNQQTYQQEVTSLAAEQRLVSALQFVTAEKVVTVYVVKGYDAASLADYGLASAVEGQNYAVKELDLIAAGGVPADADVVLLASPGLDLSAADAEHLRTYLAGGGRMLVLLDLEHLAARAPQLEELLGNYGLGVQRLLVVEGDTSRYAYSRPFYLLPKYEYHDIVAPLSSADLPLLMPVAMALKVSELKKRALTIEALLSTSENSWGKVELQQCDHDGQAGRRRGGPLHPRLRRHRPRREDGRARHQARGGVLGSVPGVRHRAGRRGQRRLLPEQPVVAQREEGRDLGKRQEPAELSPADQHAVGADPVGHRGPRDPARRARRGPRRVAATAAPVAGGRER